MNAGEHRDLENLLEQCWPSRLVVTDEPGNWSALVAEIAELEELLADIDSVEDGSDDVVARLRQLLHARRRRLRAIDVG